HFCDQCGFAAVTLLDHLDAELRFERLDCRIGERLLPRAAVRAEAQRLRHLRAIDVLRAAHPDKWKSEGRGPQCRSRSLDEFATLHGTRLLQESFGRAPSSKARVDGMAEHVSRVVRSAFATANCRRRVASTLLK